MTALPVHPSAAFEQDWRPGRSVPLTAILGALRRGTGDPTMTLGARDVWWAPHTPLGPTATWWHLAAPGHVVLRAYGPGAEWFTGRMATILGDEDDASSFVAHHPRVQRAWREPHHRDWRVARTALVVNSLVPSILEQKVTGKQAFSAFRHLVRRHGHPAPFPEDVVQGAGACAAQVARMRCAPDARGWRRVPSWDWLQAGAEPQQSRTVMRALEVAARLEETTTLPLPVAHRRLRSVPGIGVWTAAKVAQTAWGDADAPTFADYHVARQLGHAVLGHDVDDAGMARLLEPYRGHRYRAERLLLTDGLPRERRGARMSLPTHLPVPARRGVPTTSRGF